MTVALPLPGHAPSLKLFCLLVLRYVRQIQMWTVVVIGVLDGGPETSVERNALDAVPIREAERLITRLLSHIPDKLVATRPVIQKSVFSTEVYVI